MSWSVSNFVNTSSRERILLGLEVMRVVAQFMRAKNYADHGGITKGAASPRTGTNPFSGIVEDLRRSVGELQVTLYQKENTITRLHDKVSRLEKKAADAGILLSPDLNPARSGTSGADPGKRPLYRDEVDETVGFLGSNGGQMVAVSKEMWQDPRVASPTKQPMPEARVASPTKQPMPSATSPTRAGGSPRGKGRGNAVLSSSFEKRQQVSERGARSEATCEGERSETSSECSILNTGP